MKIVLVRHGESVYNKFNRENPEKRLFTGAFDTPLTEKGRQQARLLRNVQDIKQIEAIYSSPLSRAVETAKLATNHAELTLDARLIERSLGELEGHSLADIGDICAALPKDFAHSFTAKAPGGENYQEVLERTSAFFNEQPKQDLLVFAHQGSIRTMMMYLMNLDSEETLTLNIPNCQPICLEGTHFGTFQRL
ncbi:histidine phosphatase family protein [Candidatus Enterococcus willemsii]|uniref:phosphoglycerate mutase (2,3-diphosphoglycerate-dependent) n=1 Tax=Candidatus Enterococcus willemsii TaxID=1857215 RepID=A0ABQ6YVZ4_9ENTE|nr:histidine phosphatase family protein [Enterococcus sp. CU12B]KAF1301524.1 hypothetical protein BAU17_06275 [Enterococcus sp. CU12B]